MAKDITLSKSGSVNGSGTKSIGFDWGRNTSRSAISRIYTVEGGKNRLFVSQSYAALNNVKDGVNSKSVVSGDTDKQVTFNGKANGRYLRYSVSGSISATVSESSGSSSVAVGTAYAAVNNFLGGTQMYGYSITVTVPHNTDEGDYSVTVDTSDSDSPASANMSVTYTVNVTESAISVTGVDITESNLVIGVGSSYKYNDATITVDSNSRNQLHYTVSPENASIRTVEWISSNPEVATVDQNGLVTGVLNGIITGTTTITCTVTDENGGTASDMCSVTVYAYGTITLGGDITIPYNSTSGSTSVAFQNIDSLSQSDPVEPHYVTRPWLANMTYDSSESRVYATRASSDQVSLPEPTTVYVTGLDRLGNTVQSNTVSASQQMAISIDGPSTINNDDNIGSYTMSYLPFDITGSDSAVSWSFTTQQQHASITGATTSECSITVLDGATGDSAILMATNIKDSTITGQKTVAMTYNAPGTITVDPTSVSDIAFDATSDNSVSVTIDRVTNITFGCSGFIDSAEIVNGKLVAHFTANSTLSQRSGSVVIGGESGGEPVTASVMYYQRAHPGTLGSVNITSLHANLNAQGRPESADIGVIFTNNATNKRTFSNIAYELTCLNSSDEQVYSGTGTFTSVPVNASSYVDQAFSITGISATDAVTQYDLVVTCIYDSSTLTAYYSGDGTDVIS